MSILNLAPAPEQDLAISERTDHKTMDGAAMAARILVPGDLCVCLDDPNLATDAAVGVVVNSGANNAHAVEVKFGVEPIRLFSRQRLLWAGPVG